MRPLIPLAALLILPACTVADDGYPSLLPRPIETRDSAEPARPDPVATPDAALDRRIADSRTAFSAEDAAFRTAIIDAESRVAVARGVSPGGDAWLAAQAALADLDVIRGRMVEQVTELELLAAARAQAGDPAYPALDAAIAELAAIATRQADRVRALEEALAG